MSKEKKLIVDNEADTKEVYYEIIGLVLILVSVIIIVDVGIVSHLLKLISKFLIGDWYFVIAILLMTYGVSLIINKEKASLKSNRYLGIYIVLLALMMFTHTTVFLYINNSYDNNLSGTWLYYVNLINNYNEQIIAGGGIIGGLIYISIFNILGMFGIFSINLLLIIVGLVFITNSTLYGMYYSIKDRTVRIYHFTKSKYSNFLKREILTNQFNKGAAFKSNSLLKKQSTLNKKVLDEVLKYMYSNSILGKIDAVNTSFYLSEYIITVVDGEITDKHLQNISKLIPNVNKTTIIENQISIIVVNDNEISYSKSALTMKSNKKIISIGVGIKNTPIDLKLSNFRSLTFNITNYQDLTVYNDYIHSLTNIKKKDIYVYYDNGITYEDNPSYINDIDTFSKLIDSLLMTASKNKDHGDKLIVVNNTKRLDEHLRSKINLLLNSHALNGISVILLNYNVTNKDIKLPDDNISIYPIPLERKSSIKYSYIEKSTNKVIVQI